MRRAMMAIAVIVTSGCGSTPEAIQSAPGPTPGVTGGSTGAQVNLSHEAQVNEVVIEAPVADTWRVLPQAWEDAMVPVASVDNARRTLQSGVYRAPREIVGKPLSDFFDCGYTMSGPRVTLWQVSIDVAGVVLPDGEGSRIATRVTATARPRDGTSTNAVNCSSRGEIERIIAGNVRVRLGR